MSRSSTTGTSDSLPRRAAALIAVPLPQSRRDERDRGTVHALNVLRATVGAAEEERRLVVGEDRGDRTGEHEGRDVVLVVLQRLTQRRWDVDGHRPQWGWPTP